MSEDLNRNIIIQITAQTEQLEQSVTNLNKIISNLLDQQKQLIASGKDTSAAFQNNADKIDIFQKSLKDATSQLNTYLSTLNSSATALQKNQTIIAALTAAKGKYAKTLGDNSKKVNELNTAIKTLSSTEGQQQTQAAQSQAANDKNSKSLGDMAQQTENLQTGISAVSGALRQQQQDVGSNTTAFDAHKLVMDHLKTSFDEIKDVTGQFGPGLQDAAQGFNLMKSGLSVVKDGLYGVGDALKADGFDFLLQVLQQIFDAFIHSSEGTKTLRGAISAIGVVVNTVKGFFSSFMSGLINAVSHPIQSIQSLGRMIEQNIVNRFKAFGVILDGIIHLDFKKITNGAIQAFSGVTDATDKIGTACTNVVVGVKDLAGKIVTTYTDAYNQATQGVEDHEKKVKESIGRQIGYYEQLTEKGQQTSEKQTKEDSNQSSSSPKFTSSQETSVSKETFDELEAASKDYQEKQAEISKGGAKKLTQQIIADANLQKAANHKKEEEERKARNKQIENEAIKTAKQVADAAFSILTGSIKQQADAKIAALEKDKTAQLSNSSLTSAQRLAIEQKYKEKESQVKVKAFKQEQEASIAQAVINGALAITKATSQSGVLAPLVVPEIIAETAIEVAKIASQKPPAYASGGLHYTSDGKGGVLPGYSRGDNTNAYLRSGEGIVVSEAMRDPWARNLVSAINVGFGGRDFSTTTTGKGFAVGGIFTDGGDANRYYNAPVTDQKNLANTIAYQMVNNFPPVYVDVKDINNQQNILAQTINRVNL